MTIRPPPRFACPPPPGDHEDFADARGRRDAGGRGGDPERLASGGVRRRDVRAVPPPEQAAHADAGVHHSRGIRGVAKGGRGELFRAEVKTERGAYPHVPRGL